jgi:hypothetical protein
MNKAPKAPSIRWFERANIPDDVPDGAPNIPTDGAVQIAAGRKHKACDGEAQFCVACDGPILSLAGLGAVVTIVGHNRASSTPVCADCAPQKRRIMKRLASALIASYRQHSETWPIDKVEAALETGGDGEPHVLVGHIDQLIRTRSGEHVGKDVRSVIASLLVGDRRIVAAAKADEIGEALGELNPGDEARFTGRFAANGVFVVTASERVRASPGGASQWGSSLDMRSRPEVTLIFNPRVLGSSPSAFIPHSATCRAMARSGSPPMSSGGLQIV